MVLHTTAQLSVPPVKAGAVIIIKRTVLDLICTVESLPTLPKTFTIVEPPHLPAASSAFGSEHPGIGLGYTLDRSAMDALPLEGVKL